MGSEDIADNSRLKSSELEVAHDPRAGRSEEVIEPGFVLNESREIHIRVEGPARRATYPQAGESLLSRRGIPGAPLLEHGIGLKAPIAQVGFTSRQGDQRAPVTVAVRCRAVCQKVVNGQRVADVDALFAALDPPT